jgi:hypothetical protein
MTDMVVKSDIYSMGVIIEKSGIGVLRLWVLSYLYGVSIDYHVRDDTRILKYFFVLINCLKLQRARLRILKHAESLGPLCIYIPVTNCQDLN